MKHIQTINKQNLRSRPLKVVAASARLPVSPLARLLAP